MTANHIVAFFSAFLNFLLIIAINKDYLENINKENKNNRKTINYTKNHLIINLMINIFFYFLCAFCLEMFLEITDDRTITSLADFVFPNDYVWILTILVSFLILIIGSITFCWIFFMMHKYDTMKYRFAYIITHAAVFYFMQNLIGEIHYDFFLMCQFSCILALVVFWSCLYQMLLGGNFNTHINNILDGLKLMSLLLFINIITLYNIVMGIYKYFGEQAISNITTAEDVFYFVIFTFNIGYGDMYPINTFGKIASLLISFSNVIFFTFFAGVFLQRIKDSISAASTHNSN